MQNPLLKQTQFTEFNQIKITDIKEAVETVINTNKEALTSLLTIEHKTWENFIDPIEQLENNLSNLWSPVRHLNSVLSTDDLRKVYEECITLLTEYSTDLSQNPDLYKAYEEIKNSAEFKDFNEAKSKTINDALLQFKLSGIALNKEDQELYKEIQQQLSQFKISFENNILDSTQAFEKIVKDKKVLEGIPEYALSMFQQSAKQKKKIGYRLTLDMPHYIAIVTYANNQSLRKEFYTAYTTRASEFGNKDWDNSQLMVDILHLRKEKAKLLGFKDYAELSIQTKMADSAQQAEEFLKDLADKAQDSAKQDYAELNEFAKELGMLEINAWDIAWLSEQLKQQKYSISDKEIKPYLPENKVIEGLFKITNQLFDVTITENQNNIEVWHKDVKFFDVLNENNETIAHFYLDLYARDKKRGGAWMDESKNRFFNEKKKQLPIAYLTCNLTPPVDGLEALFTHDEVITLFHEFGHGIHHMFTQIDEPSVSGINGVEWDAVELPSQFMENWCWSEEGLAMIAAHHETGEKMPAELIKKMLKAKNFQSGLQLLRQVEFSLFDLDIYQKNIKEARDIQKSLDNIRKDIAVVIPPKNNRFQHGFSHIFAGGYSAGYYSYKWAEVLSADVFAAFEEEGLFNKAVGQRYKHCILEKGGSRPAIESFECFRGRKPAIEALLRHNSI